MAEVHDSVQGVEKGNISVHTENIFPIIKKSLYSDHEIFLRELVSNAVDATRKIRHLASTGAFAGELGDLRIVVSLDSYSKTLKIKDNGIGMNADEVKKYINQVAFSGAEEFMKKYKSVKDAKEIIGKFGLGFYSAFMVSSSVEIHSRSWRKNDRGIHWTCDGSTSYELEKIDLEARGTEITLHIADDSTEFLEPARIQHILEKYCKFLPEEIEFEGKVLNNPHPAWTKKPADLKDEDYIGLYKELYPHAPEPLFWIHLNVDYPFELTGILYFPKLKNEVEIRRDKIQLYSRQVFITDNVQEVVPDYLTLLQGVIDSPDIPLNVSRSYLQGDGNVKKISGYITRKVADKLAELFREDRAAFEEKWPYIEIFVKYGLISDEKFFEKAIDFSLNRDTDGKFFTFSEWKEKITEKQTAEGGKVVFLYTHDRSGQDSYLAGVAKRGWDTLVLDSMLDAHYMDRLERHDIGIQFKRVDSEPLDKLIPGASKTEALLTEEESSQLKAIFEPLISEKGWMLEAEAMGPDEAPVLLVRPEFLRRWAEMSAAANVRAGGPMEAFSLLLNTSHHLALSLVRMPEGEERLGKARRLLDLAQLGQGLLTGPDLTRFMADYLAQIG